MYAGALRDRITIEQLSTAKDGYGATSQTWSTFATVWSKVEALSGRELVTAQAINSKVSNTITIRFLSGVTARMRVRFGTRIFNIHAVRDVDGYRREMALDCEEGANLG